MKRTLSIIGIGAAFGAVSLWVWLTRGKNAKAVKAKFRLGGALLTLTSALSLVSCGGRPVQGRAQGRVLTHRQGRRRARHDPPERSLHTHLHPGPE